MLVFISFVVVKYLLYNLGFPKSVLVLKARAMGHETINNFYLFGGKYDEQEHINTHHFNL